MGWNGSGQKSANQAGETKTTEYGRRGSKKLLLSLCVVTLVGLVCFCIFKHGDSGLANRDVDKANPKISEVTPAVSARCAVSSNEPVQTVKMKTVKHPLTGVEKLVPDLPPQINSNNVSYIGQPIPGNIVNPPRRLFKHRSLGMLAGLVNAKPGSVVVGINLPKNFDLDIKDAIANERIEILPEDTPEEAETKRMVGEMLDECKKILAEGGSVREVVMEERNYLRKVADIRFTLQREICKMRREGASEDEISDAVTAANQMMKTYGDVRIRVSPFRAKAEGPTK